MIGTTSALLALAAMSGASPETAPVPACGLDPVRVEMVATIRGRGAEGTIEMLMASSPYGISVSDDGRYVTDLAVSLSGFRAFEGVTYVLWTTTPDLAQVMKLGSFDAGPTRITGQVEWNQFLVFVTAEASAEAERWEGPILMTGMSPSGKMHPKAGHGPFEMFSYLC